MFLLDTNVISELRRPDRAHAAVVKWAAGVPAAQFYISAMSLFEIELGALLAARKDEARGRMLRAWIDDHILPRFENRILAVDAQVAQRCAGLHVPDPRPDRDALIAATALVHGMTLVTHNVKDFTGTGVTFFNPWAAAG